MCIYLSACYRYLPRRRLTLKPFSLQRPKKYSNCSVRVNVATLPPGPNCEDWRLSRVRHAVMTVVHQIGNLRDILTLWWAARSGRKYSLA